jgi:hypothetical protein
MITRDFSWNVSKNVGVIPEPTTMLLFGLGGIGFSIWRRKR